MIVNKLVINTSVWYEDLFKTIIIIIIIIIIELN